MNQNPSDEPGMVAHAYNPSTWEAEAGESVQVRDQPGLQKWAQGQPELHSETLSQKDKKKWILLFILIFLNLLFIYLVHSSLGSLDS